MSPRLLSHINTDEQSFLPAIIEFVSNESLEDFLSRQANSTTPRAQLVNRYLLSQAKAQNEAIDYLSNCHEEMVSDFKTFHLANVIVVAARPEVLRYLAKMPNVKWVDWAGDELVAHDPILMGDSFEKESPGGVEPGLLAINAPAMWALGYTGRGRKVYNYDTGVWPSHPSFRDRYLGDFGPVSNAWYGYQSPTPNGKIGNHGTHTLGTIAGLDTATSDTIGVAFGAYWMANDFVASTVAGLPPLARMIDAFEWALNPDGDTATSHDVPDVINNSWRWRDDPDTVHCGGYVVDLMNAIEAAGIANVFSGGNSGPNNGTVNSPQRINTSKVNTFSVGSIDANQSMPFPISSFSTRGPTQCPGSGNLLIHPEVVAPGQNVRSAWGIDGYNSISGTSMAAPHVSGAVLLLKEAFPYLNGAQLMEALYTSALDMGPAGEDNTFGNGLIDVHAAYQYLALSHTPVNPNNVPWDVAVKNIGYPLGGEVTCDSLFAPEIVLENKGDSAISQVAYTVWVNGVQRPVSMPTWNTPNLTGKGSLQKVQLPAIVLPASGLCEIKIKVFLNGSAAEYDLVNNQRVIRFNKRNVEMLPFMEDFEQPNSFDDWYVKNEDFLNTWDSIDVTGWAGNSTAALMPFHQYNPRSNQKDGLWSPIFSLKAGKKAGLGFDLAYQQLSSISIVQDTFRVFVSTDCGKTFSRLLYEKAGADLSTTGISAPNFKPASKSDWRREYVDLSSLAGGEILISFQGTNRGGNNLYLDNISVYEGLWDPITLEELTKEMFQLYPNPTHEFFQISSEVSSSDPIGFQIFDVNGKEVSTKRAIEQDELIDVRLLPRGVYILKVQQGREVSNLRLLRE
mgnify:CR=1 FL=1